jgi:hypothetical protein
MKKMMMKKKKKQMRRTGDFKNSEIVSEFMCDS